MITKKQQQGITLLEVLLVIAIGGAILYFSIQQYLSYRTTADAMQVRSNVDAIMAAMGHYYKRNCYGYTDAQGNFQVWGSLNPENTTDPLSTPNFHIDMQTDLRDNGYLTLDLPINPFVDYTSGVGTQGYVTQFNLQLTDRQACTAPVNFPPNVSGLTPSENCATVKPMGKIVSWHPQVSVLLKNATLATTYMNLLGANCTSTASGDIVLPCSANSPGPYLVWERSPSMASMYNNTPYWPTNHIVSQFAQAYRTYDGSYLISTGGSVPGGGTQYFVCGD